MTWYLNDDTDVYEGPNEPDRIIRAVLGPNGLKELAGRVDELLSGTQVPEDPKANEQGIAWDRVARGHYRNGRMH